jgi:hypothetical protein
MKRKAERTELRIKPGETSYRRAIMRKVIGLIIIAVAMYGLVGMAAAAPTKPQQLPAGTVNIAGGTYFWFDGLAFARRYAGTPWLRSVLSVVRLCPNVKLHGFFSFTRGAGVVGRAPRDLSGCRPVVGGGAGASGCLQAMRTPYPDPYGLSGLRLTRTFVLIAATSDKTCRDLSTQVPGGIWATTNASFNGLPAGSLTVIKCQERTTQGWWDFVAPYSSKLPASKRSAVWIPDRYMNTQYSRWNGVPLCS